MRNQINDIAEKINGQVTEQFNAAATTATQNYSSANERILDAIVNGNRKAVDFAVQTADRFADQTPSFELPFDVPMADRFELPTPAEAGKRYLDVVERLADLNRDFSERVIGMLPVEAAKKPAAAKPAAKKAPAKKKAPARKAAAKK